MIQNYFGTIDDFCNRICSACTAVPDGYCPAECMVLEKARKIPIERLKAAYERGGGDDWYVIRYVKQART